MPIDFESRIVHNLLASGILIVLVAMLQWLLVVRVRSFATRDIEARRRWVVGIRNGAVLLTLAGLLTIWATELRTLAFSLVAFAVAIVVSIKELIMCLSGTFVRTAGRSFDLGDSIEIGDIRGVVIDRNFLTTTILEIGPGQNVHQRTGRAITIPNSVFLNTPVVNETFTDRYVLHVFSVPLKTGDDWRAAEKRILEAACAECSPWLDDARRHMEGLSSRHSLDAPSVEPRVTLYLPEPERIDLLVRIPAPSTKKGRVEQAILRRYLNGRADETEPK